MLHRGIKCAHRSRARRGTPGLAVALLWLTGCGSLDEAFGKKEDEEEEVLPPDPLHSFQVATPDLLPLCDGTKAGSLAYVVAEKKFYACAGNGWGAVDIKGQKGDDGTPGEKGDTGETGPRGPAGNSIAGQWRFHVNTYAGCANLSEEAGWLSTCLGTIEIFRFADGSVFVAVTGSYAGTFLQDFTHTFFVRSGTADQDKVIKLLPTANLRMLYRINTAVEAGPTFMAIVDADGNFDNNSAVTFRLTQIDAP